MFIIGHQKERKKLSNIAKSKNVAQSYIFTGPQGVGKGLCALEFASLLVGDPLFESVSERPHPFDVMIVRPEEETKRGVTKMRNIAVETVRDALLFLGNFPVSGTYRVVIIEDAQRLSMTAQNALLKTLEEPNASSVIILVTHEKGSIVPTILSRTEEVRFDFVPEQEIQNGIEMMGFPAAEREAIAPFFFSLGRPGMILRALCDPEAFAADRTMLAQLFRLSALSVIERLALSERLGTDVPCAIRLLEWWLPGLHAQAFKAVERGGTGRFFLLLENTERTVGLLKTTQGNARLLLEKLFLGV